MLNIFETLEILEFLTSITTAGASIVYLCTPTNLINLASTTLTFILSSMSTFTFAFYIRTSHELFFSRFLNSGPTLHPVAIAFTLPVMRQYWILINFIGWFIMSTWNLSSTPFKSLSCSPLEVGNGSQGGMNIISNILACKSSLVALGASVMLTALLLTHLIEFECQRRTQRRVEAERRRGAQGA